ncbi:MAG TPA: response regulator [Polyangia bacterium]|nr:response regulator [Polyangia bacterium]
MACTGGYVLVVDDDALIRDGVASVLADSGHTVKTTAHGRAALDFLLDAPPPAVILLDLMMPVMNGAEFLANKLRRPVLAAVPVYLMTASAPACLDLRGIESILRKPFAPDELLAIVQRHC